MTSPLIFYDRSRVVTDWKCPRARFWGYEYGRKGISPRRRSIYLEVGDRLHKGMADLLLDGDVDVVAPRQALAYETSLREGEIDLSTMDENKIQEQKTILEGMIRGWDRAVKPFLLRDYEIIKVEGEVKLDHDGCRLMAKPDVIARRKVDNTIWYPEWKSTGSMKPSWFRQWHKAVQLHWTAKAIEETIREKVSGVIVFGLYKGFESAYGRQESMFGYGYGPKNGLDENGLIYRYKPGLWKYPIWETTTPKVWVEGMPTDLLEKQFGETGPIYLNDHLTARSLAQTALREHDIRQGIELIESAVEAGEHTAVTDFLDKYFPQHFDQCQPGWGTGCAFHDACWVPTVQANPIGSGLFKVREPHHDNDPAFEDSDDDHGE